MSGDYGEDIFMNIIIFECVLVFFAGKYKMAGIGIEPEFFMPKIAFNWKFENCKLLMFKTFNNYIDTYLYSVYLIFIFIYCVIYVLKNEMNNQCSKMYKCVLEMFGLIAFASFLCLYGRRP